MKFKKVAALLLAGVMCAASVVGCGSNNGGSTPAPVPGPVAPTTGANGETQAQTTADPAQEEAITATITVWTPAEDQDEENGNWIKQRCEAFNAEHPNWTLTFNYDVCSEANATATVSTDPDNAADVFMFASDQTMGLIDCGALNRLGGETETYIKSTNSEAIVKTITVDGGVYGVPFTGNTWYMFYDKRVFTSEDMVGNLDKMIEAAAIQGKKVSFPVTNSWYIASFFVGNGCSFFGDGFDASKGVDFGGDKAVQVGDYLIDLVDRDGFLVDADGAGMAGLQDGSVVAVFSGSWDYANVVKYLGEENVGVACAPTYTLNGSEKQMYTFAGSKAIGVNKNSANLKVATKLALYLANPESQKLHYELRNIVPCNTELLTDTTVASAPLVKAENDTYAKASIAQPLLSEMGNYWTPAETFGKKINADKITHENVKEAVADLDDAINKRG